MEIRVPRTSLQGGSLLRAPAAQTSLSSCTKQKLERGEMNTAGVLQETGQLGRAWKPYNQVVNWTFFLTPLMALVRELSL